MMSKPLEGEILGSDARIPDFGPDNLARNEQKVRAGFWKKLRAVAGRLPFADDLLAAYYCAVDPATPTRVRAILLAALAYFIMPADMVPDLLVGVGFTDDATVLATAIGLVARHIKPLHRRRAAAALDQDRPL